MSPVVWQDIGNTVTVTMYRLGSVMSPVVWQDIGNTVTVTM